MVLFYLVCNSFEDRTRLIAQLKEKNISAVFHYLSLHKSDFYKDKHDGRSLPNCDKFADCLVRLPLFYELTFDQVDMICAYIVESFNISR